MPSLVLFFPVISVYQLLLMCFNHRSRLSPRNAQLISSWYAEVGSIIRGGNSAQPMGPQRAPIGHDNPHHQLAQGNFGGGQQLNPGVGPTVAPGGAGQMGQEVSVVATVWSGMPNGMGQGITTNTVGSNNGQHVFGSSDFPSGPQSRTLAQIEADNASAQAAVTMVAGRHFNHRGMNVPYNHTGRNPVANNQIQVPNDSSCMTAAAVAAATATAHATVRLNTQQQQQQQLQLQQQQQHQHQQQQQQQRGLTADTWQPTNAGGAAAAPNATVIGSGMGPSHNQTYPHNYQMPGQPFPGRAVPGTQVCSHNLKVPPHPQLNFTTRKC